MTQIIAILKAAEAGRAVQDVCREHEMTGALVPVKDEVRRDESRGHSAAA